jgi:hypothetical protein
MERDNECPTCKRPLDLRPVPAVWSAGNTRLSARMGVGMGMEQNKSLVNMYLMAPKANCHSGSAGLTACKRARIVCVCNK